MELRAMREPVVTCPQVVSAHQFSQRSFQQQADSEERQEIFMETQLIDMKNNANDFIDVYELGD